MNLWTALAACIGLCLQAGVSFRLQEHFFLRQHRNRYLAFLLGMILYLAVCFAGSFTLSRHGYYFLYSILRQGVLLILLIRLFQGNLWTRAALAAILCTSFELAANVASEMLSLISMLFPASWQPFTDVFICLLSYPIAALTLWFTLQHSKLRPDIFSGQICRLLFFILCGLIILTDIVYHGITHGVIMISHIGQPEVFDPYMSELLTHIECMILFLLCLAIALSLPAALNRIMQQTVSEQMYRAQIAHYQTLLREHRKQVSLRHDLKNHLLVLNRLTHHGELDKIAAYLKAMCQETCQTTDNIHTGNLTADALIAIKEQTAAAENISFTCEAVLAKKLPLEDFDLCIILGNLLDNAIQASLRIPEPQERCIVLRAKTVKRNLLLEIKNTVAEETACLDFGFADYGTGLHNVKNIIEKHHGVMDISFETSQFCVSVLLPIA